MHILIKWINRSADADGIRIYRAEESFDANSLPPILATLPPEATEYTDTAVEFGKKYYYRTAVFKGEVSKVSTELTAYTLRKSGPGPQELLDGDIECGFYGHVDKKDFTNTSALWSMLGLTNISIYNNNSRDTDWLKYSFKGKTLFIPKVPLATTSWKNLYDEGLIFGVDGPGYRLPTTITTPVNQLRIVTIKGERFIVRAIKGANTEEEPKWVDSTARSRVAVGLRGSEWDDLLLRTISDYIDPINSLPKFTNSFSASEMNANNNNTLNICQEPLKGVNILTRGYTYSTASGSVTTYHRFPGYARESSSTDTQRGLTLPGNGSSTTYIYMWRPVLEWIPS